MLIHIDTNQNYKPLQMEKVMSGKNSETKTPQSCEERGVYLFMDEVNTETCKELISFILTKTWQSPRPKELQIIINSPGGDLNAAFACYSCHQALDGQRSHDFEPEWLEVMFRRGHERTINRFYEKGLL